MLLLLIGAVAGVLFLDEETNFLPRAAPEYIPQKVKITNISDTSFTISWITQEPTIGFIEYGNTADSLDNTVVDERDQLTGSSSEYRSHYITIQELTPSTTYYFKLGSHGNQLYDNNSAAFSITTGSALSTPPSSDTAYGTIYTPADTPAEGAMVYISLPGTTPLSALVKQNGSWAISLSDARSTDLSDYASYDKEDTTIDLLIQADSGDISQVTTTTANDQPVPDITIGESADFTGTEPVYLQTEGKKNDDYESRFSIQEIVATDPDEESTITIDNIPSNDTIINQTRPQLTGSAPPGVDLTVTVHSSQVFTDSIAVDDEGSWDWLPASNFEPGEHTITLSYADDLGILHTLSRTFIVQAQGNDDAPQYEATPSATIAPSPTQNPNPTSSVSPTPTTAPTTAPTARPTSTATSAATPVAGNTLPTLSLIAISAFFILSGLFAYKKSV